MAAISPRLRTAPVWASVLLLLALFAGSARADEVVADLSSHIIAIGSGFTGDQVVLFGATKGPGDIVAVVRGPDREMTVWRKGTQKDIAWRPYPTNYVVLYDYWKLIGQQAPRDPAVPLVRQ